MFQTNRFGEAVYENGQTVAELRGDRAFPMAAIQDTGRNMIMREEPPISIIAGGLLLNERVHCTPRCPSEMVTGDGRAVRGGLNEPVVGDAAITALLARVNATASQYLM